jgi:hypothetical protein
MDDYSLGTPVSDQSADGEAVAQLHPAPQCNSAQVELALMPTAMPLPVPVQPIADAEEGAQPVSAAATSIDVQPSSAQMLPKPRIFRTRRRSSDVDDDSRLFGSQGSCARPPSSWRSIQRSQIRTSGSQGSDDGSSERTSSRHPLSNRASSCRSQIRTSASQGSDDGSSESTHLAMTAGETSLSTQVV